jgi:hypothetical protein
MRCAPWRRNDAAFREHYGANLDGAMIDRALDEMIDYASPSRQPYAPPQGDRRTTCTN